MISGHTDLWGHRRGFLLIWSLTLHFMLAFRDDHYGSSDAGELKRLCGFWLPDLKFFACKHRVLSIYEKTPEISVVAKVEFPIGKKLFHLVVNPGTWHGARPWTWNWYKLRET